MRYFKRLIAILVAVALGALVLAYLLPRNVQVSRSITIAATPDQVFPFINALQEGQKWSPWLARDRGTRLAYSGPSSGVGNRLDWRSDHPGIGSGTQIITASVPDRSVETTLDFGNMGMATARFALEPAGTGTLVTWQFVTDTGLNPAARWMGLMMDRWVGSDYEAGLRNLKSLVEGG